MVEKTYTQKERLGGLSRKLEGHMASTLGNQRMNGKWSQAIRPQSRHHPGDTLPSSRSCLPKVPQAS